MPPFSDFDTPSDDPLFGFPRLAAALAATMQGERREAAFVLGLHGPWGAGKTTLMRAIRRQLPQADIVVDFNAWKYEQKEALWRALILRVLEALRQEQGQDPQVASKIDEMQRSLYEHFSVTEQGPMQVNWVAATATAVQVAIGAAGLGLGGAAVTGIAGVMRGIFGQKKDAVGKAEDTAKQIERAASILQRQSIERAVQQVVSIEQFLATFRQAMESLGAVRRLYVLVDDLDRCLPETALGIFEAIKLFLDAPQCAYVVAVDRTVIRRGLELRYPAKDTSDSRPLPPIVDPDEYIEKTITLSVDLPMLADADGYSILSMANLADRFAPVEAEAIVFVLGTIPRRLKRFGGTVALWQDIARALVQEDKRSLAFSPLDLQDRPLFLKLGLIGYINSALLTEMRRDPGLPIRLQQTCNANFQGGQPAAKSVTARAGTMAPGAAAAIGTALRTELPVVAQSALDPALWRAFRIEPNFAPIADRVAAALRWFREAAQPGAAAS